MYNKRVTKKIIKKKRNKKRASIKQKGGRILGVGLTGIVTMPALSCLDPSKNPSDGGNTVSKLTDKVTAESEFESTRILAGNPLFKIPFSTCEWNKDRTIIDTPEPYKNPLFKKDWLLFLPYGGIDLNQLCWKDIIKNRSLFIKILKAYRKFISVVYEWNFSTGLTHLDLNWGNILYDEELNTFFITDAEGVVAINEIVASKPKKDPEILRHRLTIENAASLLATLKAVIYRYSNIAHDNPIKASLYEYALQISEIVETSPIETLYSKLDNFIDSVERIPASTIDPSSLPSTISVVEAKGGAGGEV